MIRHHPTATHDGPTHPRAALRLRGGALLSLSLLVALLVWGCGGGGGTVAVAGSTTTSADSQMDFGIQMAQQGLWSEALFRFRQAARLDPNDYRVYNNLAVAYEATGQFEEALQAYQQALQLASDNRDLRRNYARFAEFYQSFRPQPEAGQAGGGQAAEQDREAAGAGNGAGAAQGSSQSREMLAREMLQ